MQFSLTDDSSYCIQASSDIAAAVHTVNKVASTTCSSSSSSSRSWERLSSSCLEDTDNLPMCETPDSSLLVSVSNNNNSDQAPNKNPCCEDSSDILSPMTTAMSLSASDTSQKSASKDAGSTLPVQTVETFFSRQKYRFSDIELAENLDIPTTRFLDACRGLTSIFDLLGSTTFAPVKMDMNGNIGKLQKKYDSDPVKFALLQSMMRQEMQDKTTRARNSATDALLWLKRGVEFTYEFFVLFLRGDPDLTNCATAAYSKTLRKYHGWVARGLLAVCLSVASRAIPYRSDFVRLLALNPPAEIDVSQFDQQVHSECVEYITGVSKILKVINQFYQENNLDSTEIV